LLLAAAGALVAALALAQALPRGTLPAAAQPPRERPELRFTADCAAIHGMARRCGRIDRPLDPAAPAGRRIGIYFEFYPHSAAGPALGTLVATEGGPGYPATQSRDDYLRLFGPLRRRHDVLLMDNRGSGRSAALDCHALQTAAAWTSEGVGACGESLGAQAALFGTAYAADDLAAILAALGAGPVDLYGDSYGTYFAQVFALRHPRALRSLVLDGAYPLNGPDYAWYPTYAPAVRDKFNRSCSRDPVCAALPGDSMSHIEPAIEALRRRPFTARAADADGHEHRFTANVTALATVLFAAAPALASLRETDAAARAFTAGDRVPLLRLMAETAAAVDSRDPTGDPRQWSAGLAAAVLCGDPPQVFDMRLPPALRAAERDRLIAARRRNQASTYAPISIDEYRAMPLDYSFIDLCVNWPARPQQQPTVPAPDAVYPDVPALILSGDLDDITTVADGAAVARAFPHARQVVIENGLHVNALPRGRSACPEQLVRRFIAAPAGSLRGDPPCRPAAQPVRLVGEFTRSAARLPPAVPLPGNTAPTELLRIAAAAVITVGDVLLRAADGSGRHGVGLRGGSFRVQRAGARLQVRALRIRWTEDVEITGDLVSTGDLVGAGARGGSIRARVEVRSPAAAGSLRIGWREGAATARARVSGSLGGRVVAATSAVP
jgi:pimeloyl-ACP methyl ester carboxylesterase